MTEKARSYHKALRAIGAWLDAQAPKAFTIFETNDTFVVVVTPNAPDRPTRTEMFFDSGALAGREEQGVKRRGFPAPDTDTAHWSITEASREEVLRALGYELDETDAASILIDQLDDQIILTYSYLDARMGLHWSKRAVFLGTEQVEQILEVARSRRPPEPVRQQRRLFRR